jgi:hypothetical protein
MPNLSLPTQRHYLSCEQGTLAAMKVFIFTAVALISGLIFVPKQTLGVLLAWGALRVLYQQFFAI